MSIKAIISKDLDIPIPVIEKSLSLARKHVKRIVILKRDKTERYVYQPAVQLKTIQYWLIHNVFKHLPVHPASLAYIEGKSVLDNAKLHRHNQYFLKLDLKDFFPSITYVDLAPKIKERHAKTKPNWALDMEAHHLIIQSCFYLHNKLAIGYPCSPMISNIVMFDFDHHVSEVISNTEKFGNVVYTRYADDLIFSTNKSGACKELLPEINKLIQNSQSPIIQVNDKKTKLSSSSAGSASVTGLKVNVNGHITIHRNQKDHVRLLLSLYRKKGLKEKEVESLLGHLAYIRHVDPSFFTKLHQKYFQEIKTMQQLKDAL